MWLDSFTRLWLICDLTHSLDSRRDSILSLWCVTLMSHVTYLYTESLDSLTWLWLMCDVTHSLDSRRDSMHSLWCDSDDVTLIPPSRDSICRDSESLYVHTLIDLTHWPHSMCIHWLTYTGCLITLETLIDVTLNHCMCIHWLTWLIDLTRCATWLYVHTLIDIHWLTKHLLTHWDYSMCIHWLTWPIDLTLCVHRNDQWVKSITWFYV